MNKNIFSIILFTVLLLVAYGIGYFISANKYIKECNEKEPTVITIKEPVIVHDTVTNLQYKDKYHYRTDTCYLPVVDTITDTAYVEVPIYRYTYDTITPDSTHLRMSLSGFNVNVDTIQAEYLKEKTTVVVQENKKDWHWGFGFAIGFGYVK
jgi:hypothetical protein